MNSFFTKSIECRNLHVKRKMKTRGYIYIVELSVYVHVCTGN